MKNFAGFPSKEAIEAADRKFSSVQEMAHWIHTTWGVVLGCEELINTSAEDIAGTICDKLLADEE